MATISYAQLLNEISKIVERQVTSAISNLNYGGAANMTAQSFAMNEMKHLTSDMSLPQSVFRKYLEQIFPITVAGNAEVGDMLVVNDERDVKFNAGLTYFRGVYAAAEVDALDDDINPLEMGLKSGDIIHKTDDHTFWKYVWVPDDYEFNIIVEDEGEESSTFMIGNYFFVKVGSIDDLKDGMLVQAGENLYKKSNETLVPLPTLEELDLRLRVLEGNE